MSNSSACNKRNLPLKATKLSVDEISTTTTSVTGTLKLSENLEIGGDGLILSDLDNIEFSSSDTGETITYEDDSTATATYSSATVITSSVSKTISTEENINLNGRTYTITQTGTTITLVETLKKIVSLEGGNLVISTYKADGTRIDKEIIMDSNNSISEISDAEFDLKVKSLDVTKTDSVNETTPSEGSVRIDGSLILNPSIITSASISIGSPTDLDESISVFYFDLNSDSAMYGIFAAGTTGQIIHIFYDNVDTSGSIRIDFGSTKLRTGSGNSQYLTFSTTGQSASLIYISTVDKWCILNTGASVS